MKKTLFSLFVVSALLISCSKEAVQNDSMGGGIETPSEQAEDVPEAPQRPDGPVSLIASSGSITKTEISGTNQILWKAGDKISVWEKDNSSNSNIQFSLAESAAGSATGKFTGSLTPASETFELYSIYPYSSSYGADATSLSLTIPGEVNQATSINDIVGVSDFMLGRTSYADYDAEAGAYTTEFWHPLAFLKFHIDCSDCVYADAVLKSLTMTANVAFVGSVNVDCIGGTVTSTAVGDAGKTLVVNFPNTAVASSAQDAWVAIKPVDLTDANCQFVLEMTNGQKVTFAVNPAKVFKASHQYLLEFSDIDTKIAQKKGTQTYVDLIGRSGGNRANCYIVNSGGYYRFAAQKVDKSNVFAGSQPTTDGYKAYWFWCSGASSFISGVGIGNSGNINFRVSPNAEGNASIVLMDPSGVIVWSWHIWYSRTDPLTPTHYVYTSAYTLAKRNLGALSDDGAGGLYYQWGRKDPFPASNSSGSVFNSAVRIDGHGVSFNALTSVDDAVTPDAIGYTISHPSTMLYGKTYHTWITTEDQANNAQSLWSISASTKTNYDPCPPGYMVPISSNAWRDNFTAANVNFDEGGLTFDDGNTSSYYPASGYLSGWTFTNTEGYIRCWTATLSATPAYNAHMFGRSLFCKTSDSSISTTEAARSQFGMPVRCMVKP